MVLRGFHDHSASWQRKSNVQYKKFRKRQVMERYGKICSLKWGFGCGATATERLLTLDHIIPIWNGGTEDDLDNMQLLCRSCHKIKRLNEDTVREKKMMIEMAR